MRSRMSKPQPVPGTQRGPDKWWFSSEPSSEDLVRGEPEIRELYSFKIAASALFLSVIWSLSFQSWDSSSSGSNVGSFPDCHVLVWGLQQVL